MDLDCYRFLIMTSYADNMKRKISLLGIGMIT